MFLSFLFFFFYRIERKRRKLKLTDRAIPNEKFNTKIGNRLIQISREASDFSIRRVHLCVSGNCVSRKLPI